MGFLFCFKRRNSVNVVVTGNEVESSAMIISACRIVAEKMSKKRGMKVDEAMDTLLESIIDIKKVFETENS